MEANLFIKKYKTEGNKIKDLQFYGDMEVDIGGSGGGSDKYYYATGEILFDELDEFITPIKVPIEGSTLYTDCFMIQVPVDSYLYVGLKKLYSGNVIDQFVNGITDVTFLPGGTSYSIEVQTSGWYGTNFILFSKDALIKGYGLTNTFIESLF